MRFRFAAVALLLALAAGAGAAQPTAAPLHLVTETSAFAYAEGGRVGGPATAHLETLLRSAGIDDYRIDIYPWARAYDLALKQPNVLIYLIARTPEREQQFKWIGAFIEQDYDFYRLRSRHDIAVGQLADARRYSVGVVRDDVRHQFLRAQGFTRLLLAAQSAETVRHLLNQRVDLVLLTETDLMLLCRQSQLDCAQLQKLHRLAELRTPLYAAFSRSTPDELVQRVRRAFDSLKAEGKLKL
ncbi:substrate-binding periplasmic protein [Paucibacter soli]|uniref:substrate-binding periplasmic protein n=1 Tax=Paucibacter soli TaxID=3133433 RepID=UPI00309906EA